ncbi:pleckstrin homology domain-containing family F member 1 [Salarias fasciatus]|uniref:Pleckstrin homology domain-containing family F member 1-like n=1 Tax=Salarias fasciatus TaxID=181472 RepID=A0A672H2C7_SALFA|nr:pleckstrin homology domain-containing family F member 1-like [Salarias fasciatus]
MVDHLTFSQENRDRICAVQNSFGPSGKPLLETNRVLIGEGRLMKMSPRGGPQPKVFFLFNDVLVYGSIILNGRWYKKQKIIPLEEIQLEELEDGLKMKNQWLIRTPRKSFYVGASSQGEKQAWVDHIRDCQAALMQGGGRRASSDFAVTWIPDKASAICMRCSNRFSLTQRRHHCRRCGFVVCAACSKARAVIRHMHPTKPQRVCTLCYSVQSSAWSSEKTGSEEDEVETSSEEEEVEEKSQEAGEPSRWLDSGMDPWSVYVYLKPEHRKPQTYSS